MIVSPNADPITLLKPESSWKSVESPPARLTTTASGESEKSSVLTPRAAEQGLDVLERGDAVRAAVAER